MNVRVHPKGPTWRRHIDQLCPRYRVVEDTDPGETPTLQSGNSSPFPTILTGNGTLSHTSLSIVPPIPPVKRNYRKPTPTEDIYEPTNPRSARIQQRLEWKRTQNYNTTSDSGIFQVYILFSVKCLMLFVIGHSVI